MLIGSLQISAYVLAAGHYAMIGGQPPKWLMYPFWITICVFAALYLPLVVAAGYLGLLDILRTLAGIDLVLFIAVDLIVLDVSFCRIRRSAMKSDQNAASTSKIMPRMKKAARTVLIVNVVFLAIGIFLMVRAKNDRVVPNPDGSYNVTIAPGVILALMVTQWWTYHPLFPVVKDHKTLTSRTISKTRTSASSRPSSSRPSRPTSGASPAASPRGSQGGEIELSAATADVCVNVPDCSAAPSTATAAPAHVSQNVLAPSFSTEHVIANSLDASVPAAPLSSDSIVARRLTIDVPSDDSIAAPCIAIEVSS
jgi:hypothetical protein